MEAEVGTCCQEPFDTCSMLQMLKTHGGGMRKIYYRQCHLLPGSFALLHYLGDSLGEE